MAFRMLVLALLMLWVSPALADAEYDRYHAAMERGNALLASDPKAALTEFQKALRTYSFDDDAKVGVVRAMGAVYGRDKTIAWIDAMVAKARRDAAPRSNPCSPVGICPNDMATATVLYITEYARTRDVAAMDKRFADLQAMFRFDYFLFYGAHIGSACKKIAELYFGIGEDGRALQVLDIGSNLNDFLQLDEATIARADKAGAHELAGQWKHRLAVANAARQAVGSCSDWEPACNANFSDYYARNGEPGLAETRAAAQRVAIRHQQQMAFEEESRNRPSVLTQVLGVAVQAYAQSNGMSVPVAPTDDDGMQALAVSAVSRGARAQGMVPMADALQALANRTAPAAGSGGAPAAASSVAIPAYPKAAAVGTPGSTEAGCPDTIGYARDRLVYREAINEDFDTPIDTMIQRAGGITQGVSLLTQQIAEFEKTRASAAETARSVYAGSDGGALAHRCLKNEGAFCAANYTYHLLGQSVYVLTEIQSAFVCRLTGRMSYADYRPVSAFPAQ